MYTITRLNANIIQRRPFLKEDQRLKNKLAVKLEMELVERGGVERKTTTTRKQDNITESHKKIFGARA
jgi:hypothetical protein